MVEVMEGCDWKQAKVLKEQDGAFVCLLPQKGTRLWVAWSEGRRRTVRIDAAPLPKEIRVTPAIPAGQTGRDVDYGRGFAGRKAELGDAIEVEVDDMPLYVEER
jgi:hypothetical protein